MNNFVQRRTVCILIGAPALVLCDLSALYALVPAACASAGNSGLQALNSCCFTVVLAGFVSAMSEWRRQRSSSTPCLDREGDQAAFLALVSTCVSALCAVTLVAFWIPQWVLDPCAG